MALVSPAASDTPSHAVGLRPFALPHPKHLRTSSASPAGLAHNTRRYGYPLFGGPWRPGRGFRAPAFIMPLGRAVLYLAYLPRRGRSPCSLEALRGSVRSASMTTSGVAGTSP